MKYVCDYAVMDLFLVFEFSHGDGHFGEGDI